MAEVLLIKRGDIIAHTSLNGNVDEDKFRQYIKIAQDVYLERYLGTDLLTKLKSDISGSSLTGNYATLVNTWIKPALIHWTMYEAIPHLAVTIANGGIFRHVSENGETLTKEEVDSLAMRSKELAVHYTDRLVDYLSHNTSLFPEYLTNTNEDVSPKNSTNYTGWVL